MGIGKVLCFATLLIGAMPLGAAETCANLAGLKIKDATIKQARTVAAGAFVAPAKTGKKADPARYQKVPPFCRVMITATPSSDSLIKIEVWLPSSGWNGKLKAFGNGGFAGSIAYDSMASALKQGFATAATDAGHEGEATESDWALHHPEKIVDFGYRAIHEMTEKAKQIVKDFYGSDAKRALFDACSDGGREALMEAQRFPADYDAILAGAPANYWTHLLGAGLVASTALMEEGGYIPPAKLPAITNAVMAACDSQDGVKDGILNDPRRCRFDPAVLQCRGADTNACLTARQVKTLKVLYGGGRDAQGHLIFPGLSPGSELGKQGWEQWVTGPARGQGEIFSYVNGFFRNMVFDNPAWSLEKGTVGDVVKTADSKMAPVLNAIDPNLAPFRDRGGKLILYHGWNDPAIAPLNTINYYESVKAKLGESSVKSFVRLYMGPGMQHCAGGPGPSFFGQLGISGPHDAQHDVFKALEKWSESGPAPEAIIATKYADDDPGKEVQMTRPLCPYPLTAKYKGSGDPNQAANFSCSPNE